VANKLKLLKKEGALNGNRKELLKQIKDEVMVLKSSPLYAERTKNKVFPVIGEGDHFAKIMFVGEAPGKNEAATGRPFCGAAGKILDELLASVAIDRKSVYITNIVKDRPPLTAIHFQMRSRAMAHFSTVKLKLYSPR